MILVDMETSKYPVNATKCDGRRDLWSHDSRQGHPPHVSMLIWLQCYTRAFGDGPRNFEPWSSDVDDTSAGTPSPNYHITPTGGTRA
ncbi:hypothetical protein TNCV_3008321 [Trichonephila clavipes]|nr:hypothetical protein TNCV_3008321 [Trichonephila clavipes]